jgi:Flp pilus assembly protein TadG
VTTTALARPGRNPRHSPISRCVGGIARWSRDRRGVVAVLFALAAPVLGLALGAGIEVSRWSVAMIELQRIADAAALAGAFDYQNQPPSVAQTAGAAEDAAKAAANLAQINGVSATASPVWNTNTQTFPDGLITVQVVSGPGVTNPSSGVRNPGDFALQVTVSRAVPLFLAGFFTKATTQTVSATAIAELVGTPTGAACVLALQGDVNGITSNQDISVNNGSIVTQGNCSLRSDGNVNLSGGVQVAAPVVAAGQVIGVGQNGASIKAPFTATSNAGQVSDPLHNDAALQAALKAAATVTGPNDSCTGSGQAACSLSPGTFTGIAVSNGAPLTMAPGLYIVGSAGVDFGGGSVTIAAGGVTIATSGTITIGNGVTVNGLDAAATGSTAAAPVTSGGGGAIPGVVLATSSSSSNAMQFNGGASFVYSGVFYAPNGSVAISNGVSATTPACAEVVANDISLTGGATFSSNACLADFGIGLPGIPSQLTTTATLVQ